MKKIKTITTEEIKNIEKWGKGSLYEAYNKPSIYKKQIWEDICNRPNTYGHFVRSCNCNFFTVAYWTKDDKFVIVYPTREEVYEIVY